MHHYHNLLYVSHGITDEIEGLKQALSLARNNNAPLRILVISPEFPKNFPEYQKKFEASLLDQTKISIQKTQKTLNLLEDSVDISIELISDKTPAIKIIQQVLRYGHDLVIKEVEPRDKNVGFKALDMDLLRKCPSAVWLSRPIQHSRKHIQVAVAIDPETQENPAAEVLSKRMLEVSRSLADSCSGELHIVSCWDYMFEKGLRQSVWINVSDDEITNDVLEVEHEHRMMLEKLIKVSGISNTYQIHHLRGEVDEMIPNFVQDKKIDILVMGTVGRTGIPGFIIGNTAENTFQELTCSLMALKPQGFISPVKAY